MVHNALRLLTTLLAVLLFGAPLTGCTASWSGSIELDVHGLTHVHPTPAENTP